MDSVYDNRVWTLLSFLIQKSPDQWMFAPPRSLSQLTTSFVGSQCQGILLAPFVAWPFKCSRICSFQILHLPTRFYRLVKLYCLQLYHGFNILLLISCFAVLYSVFKVHPALSRCIGRKPISWFPVVGWNGLEPSTSRLSAECSNQLSYQPKWWR